MMQYHLNGFRPGDPDVIETLDNAIRRVSFPDQVDVLIVGCGPAGLTLAAQLCGFPDIMTRIVEVKPGPIEKGQADGISCRSMEMFQAFGFADKIKREAYWVNETTFWKADPENTGNIIRNGRVQDVADDLSEMPHTLMNQARVHEMYLDIMRNAPAHLEPDYGLKMLGLTIDPDAGDHPVTVKLQYVCGAQEGEIVTVRANYVVGCDGARSAVRKAIGGKLHGESANQAWGVMDVLAVTDFPDIRMKSIIQSASEGNILILPREGGYLFRMYVELDPLSKGERVASRDLTVDTLIASANRIIHPYSIDVKEVVWWSIYEIGQRLTDKFDDVPADQIQTRSPRIFTAGDACHTHSPKAGQGMNVSMGDTFNLGWKLIQVTMGRAAPELLHSYSAERRSVAKALIDFDHEWSRIVSTRSDETEVGDAQTPEFQKYFIEHGRYTAGVSVKYEPSVLTGAPTWQHLATGFEIGTRFHSAPVIRLADAKPMQLGHIAKADACWRIYAFASAGDTAAPGSAIHNLCDFLENAANSPIRRFTPTTQDIDAVIDMRAIFQRGFRDLNIAAMPPLLLPHKGCYGLRDYEKVFCADQSRQSDIFDLRGINRHLGCMVIVRPDQYVAHILPLSAHDELTGFFAGVLIPVDG